MPMYYGGTTVPQRVLQDPPSIWAPSPFTGEALIRAADEGKLMEVQRILRSGKVSPNMVDDERDHALMEAAESGHLRVCKLLVKAYGANIDLEDDDGQTALTEAAEEGNAEVLAFLMKAGANKLHKTKAGKTALMLACENSHADAAAVLA